MSKLANSTIFLSATVGLSVALACIIVLFIKIEHSHADRKQAFKTVCENTDGQLYKSVNSRRALKCEYEDKTVLLDDEWIAPEWILIKDQ